MSTFVGDGRRELVDPATLRSVDDHRALIVRAMPRPRHEVVATADASGRVLAGAVRAARGLPAFTNSAMDGWAVVADDLTVVDEATPVVLQVAGEVAAGPVADDGPRVDSGRTVAVMTGAPLPVGADAVVPVEHTTSADDDGIAVHTSVRSGQHVRRAGEEIAAGDVVLSAGHRIGPADLGLLLSIGVVDVEVVAAPRVAIITTGDELVQPGEEVGPGQIVDSNGPMLAAMAAGLGCEVVRPGIARDTLDDLVASLRRVADDCDVILLSGGVSAGAHDHVAQAIGEVGDVETTRLAMRPGMPQALGRIGRTAVIGLPGNPVSSFVSFEVLVRPALRILQGRRDVLRPSVVGVLDDALTSPAGKREYVRVRLSRADGTWRARLAGGQGSHMLGALSRADALAVIPEDATDVRAGSRVRLHLLTG